MVATTYVQRFAEPLVREALSDTPIVIIQGARQVGKSTLAGIVGNAATTVSLTLDDPTILQFASDDPTALINQNPSGLLIIDEAQRAPGIILPLKAAVDRDRRPGRFLLTGSANLLQVKGVGDSLAGRAETIELMPLSQGEMAKRKEPEDFVTWLLSGGSNKRFPKLDNATVLRGGYPTILDRDERRAERWLTDYADRLATHDAPELAGGSYAQQFTKMLAYFATAGQGEFVKANLSNHLGVAQSTVDSYWQTLRQMRLVYDYPAWNRNLQRRTVKRPKVSLVDTGLAAALANFTSAKAESLGGREYFGLLLEQFVALELRKQQLWSETPFQVFHYRDHDNLEVDLLLETRSGELIAVEVKATTTPSNQHWKNLERFKALFPDRNVTGVLLHTGTVTLPPKNGWLHILPVTSLWKH